MSNNAEKISVIVPCYNVGAYVEKCLLSILNQHYTNIEVLAVDDGSADGTPAVLDRLARQYPQLKVIHQKNAGVSAARNTGLAHAQGDYVVFVDGDDYLAPDYMDYMLELIHKTGADFALSTQWFRKKTDKQTPRPSMQTVSSAQAVALLLSPNVVVGCWNKIYKRSLLTRHQCRFNTELFYGEGLNFIITVAQLAGKIAVGNRKVYYYRRNNAASATTRFNIHTLQSNTQSLDLIEQNLKVRCTAACFISPRPCAYKRRARQGRIRRSIKSAWPMCGSIFSNCFLSAKCLCIAKPCSRRDVCVRVCWPKWT